MKDITIIKDFLAERNPFSSGEDLMNIVNGMHATPEVNADRCHEVGLKILASMNDKNPANHVFRRSDQVVTLASRNCESKRRLCAY